MDIRDYTRILRKRWLSIVLLTVLGGALAFAYSASATKVYSATAQNFVSIGGTTTEGANQTVFSGASFALQRVKSYVELVDSPQVLEPVIEELGLNTSVAGLAGQVTAVNPPQTVLLDVTVTDGVPTQAAVIADAVAVEYAKQIELLETTGEGKKATSPIQVTTTAPASLPSSPISPRTTVNVALGLLLGLGLGLAWALIREQLDNTVKSPEVLNELTGATTLGIIGYDSEAPKNPLVALDQQSNRAEAFRTVRTNLQYVDVDNPPRIVTITSAMPNEGKTTTACNLAITLAQSGKSVCLVEGDLRRPKLAEYLGIESQVGLTDVLVGEAALDSVLLPWNRYLLTVLPTGAIPPNPSELLSSQQMRATLQELGQKFDVVIVDAAPIIPVADGAIVAAAADGAVLVTRYGKTTREQVTRTMESLQQVDARVLGVAMNFAPSKRRGYGGYGYSYGYGYGYGYQAESENKSKSTKRKQAKAIKKAAVEDTKGDADVIV